MIEDVGNDFIAPAFVVVGRRHLFDRVFNDRLLFDDDRLLLGEQLRPLELQIHTDAARDVTNPPMHEPVMDAAETNEIPDIIAPAATSEHDVMHVEQLPHRATWKLASPQVAIEDGLTHRVRQLFFIVTLNALIAFTGRQMRTEKLRE